MKQISILLASLFGVLLLTTSCNDEWKDEQYEHFVSFKAPLNDGGVSAVYVPYSRHNDDGSLTFGEHGLSNYLLPVIVSGTTTNGANFTVGVEESDTLTILNYERFQNRSDLYYVNMSQYASYPSTVEFKAGEDISLLDIRFDFKGIDMSQKWVLPIRVAGPANNGFEPHPRKHYAQAMLRVYPYNDFSGSYSATTQTMARWYTETDNKGNVKRTEGDFAGGETSRGYVVDENTIFFYAGNNIDETRTDRKNYKVFAEFQPEPLNPSVGNVRLYSDNPDMKFVGHEQDETKTQPTFSIYEQKDEVQPYLIHRYLIISDIDYDFTDYTLVPGQERNYVVRGTLTMERKINTQIPNEDQAIEW
ncbi:MAG: DUF4973 domain-containing protein [Prevotella sp.]|nr:DUF4973 domain-containing protein [Prevotella sp.]